MEIRFQVEAKDYFVAQKYISRSLVIGSFWSAVPFVACGVFGFCTVLGMYFIYRFHEKYNGISLYELKWSLRLFAVGFIALTLGLISLNRAIKTRLFNPHGLSLSPHKITLEEDHMVITVRNSTSQFSYGDILKVEDDQNYVYIFIDRGVAYYIPVREFATAEVRQAFIDFLSNKIESRISSRSGVN